MQLCCHAAAELTKHAYIVGQSSKQCSYVAMQLRNLTNMNILWVKVASSAVMLPCSCGTWQTCIYYGPKQQVMQLCCHAAADLNKHEYIMGQSSKQCNYVAMKLRNLTTCNRQCSYVAMQLQNLTNIHIYIYFYYYGPKWQAMQLCGRAAVELDKHAKAESNAVMLPYSCRTYLTCIYVWDKCVAELPCSCRIC